MTDDPPQFEFMTVRAIRGREANMIAKWQRGGWELDHESRGTLRSEMTFKRPKPKSLGYYVSCMASRSRLAIAQMTPGTKWTLAAATGSLVLLIPVAGVVIATRDGTEAPASKATATTPSQTPAATSALPPPSPPATTVPEYVYTGPRYEVLIKDLEQGPAKLTQYWVHTSEVDPLSRGYQSQVKAIITDLARTEGTDSFFAEVVTDKKIAQAESPSTYEKFVSDYGMDYAINVIPQLEKLGWVASYAGGFDVNAGEASQSPDGYTVIWRPYATGDTEKWKPEAP